MKIAICGNMNFAKEMMSIESRLKEFGHACHLPEDVGEYSNNKIDKIGGSEGAKRKIENDLIRKHYNLIDRSDAILVLNYNKNGIDNYIGGNSFLEMGYAYILNKKIYLINNIPKIELIKQEIEAMQPIILNGDLSKII
ncbi:MAG: hypothetical protein ABIH51_02615 [Patescibacteria group bacterium]